MEGVCTWEVAAGCCDLVLESVKTHLLLAEESKITPLLLNQLLVGAHFHKRTLVHHQDLISRADGGEAMGDEEDRAALKGFFEIETHLTFGDVVKRTRCFVQNQ